VRVRVREREREERECVCVCQRAYCNTNHTDTQAIACTLVGWRCCGGGAILLQYCHIEYPVWWWWGGCNGICNCNRVVRMKHNTPIDRVLQTEWTLWVREWVGDSVRVAGQRSGWVEANEWKTESRSELTLHFRVNESLSGWSERIIIIISSKSQVSPSYYSYYYSSHSYSYSLLPFLLLLLLLLLLGMNGEMLERMDERKNGRMSGWMNGCIDEWTIDVWTNE
jgi:hypothetical protein